ncbi:hypothetical protein Zm00014a_021073 [Zea mays]|uniref:Uncharacterized protein n=1 Tax=Zea mays TaxID=4577 RepID=A0A3L6E0W0_MAIZE|nr:hypothetical protein Zm00014a_021073 [Zea mays]
MVASSVAFVVSGSFTPRSGRKPSPVQLSRVRRLHPAELSLSSQSRGDAGVNPCTQAHAAEPPLVSQAPKAPQCA